jgi:hypothetical protein
MNGVIACKATNSQSNNKRWSRRGTIKVFRVGLRSKNTLRQVSGRGSALANLETGAHPDAVFLRWP